MKRKATDNLLQDMSCDIIDELLIVLDTDIQHIRDGLSRLNELRSCVIKRDEAALSKLLNDIKFESDDYAVNESKRQEIRKKLAIAMNCKPQQVTLSGLEPLLTEEKAAQVNKRKAKLIALIGELKKEHLSTALLLSDCAKFNSLLLNSILDLGSKPAVTYNSDGATKRQTDTTLVNMQF